MNRITPVETLRTGWKLVHDPKNEGREQKWYQGIPQADAASAEVPCYVHQVLPDCQGIAWYQIDFDTAICPDADQRAVLHFEMADFLCEAWLNGEWLGLHRGTENPFDFDATAALKPNGINRLCIRVSKPYTEDVDGYSFWEIPHRNQLPTGINPGTCYNAYGLCGEISILLLPKVAISDLYLFANPKTQSIEAQITVVNTRTEAAEVRIALTASEKRTGIFRAQEDFCQTFEPGETVLTRTLPISEMRLWDVDDPWLYSVDAEICAGEHAHRVSKRCGFRTFMVGQDGYFYLNGRRLFLRCSHTGNCMPESTWNITRDHELLRKDFSMAKSIGMNMVRFISGAALPEQLDLCDELGLMVYEEPVSGWLQQNGPRVKELYQYDLLTMIQRDRSHACVTIWGLLNETTDEPPFNDCCRIARASISEVRALDETRLLIYSSGRFDNDPRVGSVCNPFSHKWECLWDGEDVNLPGIEPYTVGDPGPTRRKLGDKHYYPRQPHSHEDIAFFRSIGSDTKRPFFLTEYGVGSLFDVIWLSRKFEQMSSNPRYPDVAMVKSMADSFLSDLKKYGFEREYAFPIDIMKESHRLHNDHRSLGFDIFRSNPYLNGVSLTGLLDHSICGEGLWTLLREWKSGIADTLQDGFAPLRWCLFTEDPHLYSGKPFGIEGVLANEDVLQVRDYPIGLKIVGKDGIVWEEEFTLHVHPENLKGMAVPVFKRTLDLNLPEGEYTLCAEILEGAAATCGRLHFYVSDDAKTQAKLEKVIGICIGEAAETLLKRKGVAIVDPSDITEPMVALVGNPADKEKPQVWETVRVLLAKGCRVFVASRFAAAEEMDMTKWLPMEQKPLSMTERRDSTDWLYHMEYLAKRSHPYFANMPAGMMDWNYYRYIICGAYYRSEQDAQDIASICFSTGECKDGGYRGGMELCGYDVGGGRLILNAYLLLENLNINPAADRLMINILNTENEALSR